MDIGTVKPALINYINALKRHIKINGAVVYGSLASGHATIDSDIDLLVISDDLARYNEDEREKLLYRTSVGFPYDLHVYGVTKSEFEKASKLTTLGAIRSNKTIELLS